MKHVHWRALVVVALSLPEVGAWAQFVGQANDAGNLATAATSLGEIRMPGDPSAAPVERTIDADFYGAEDSADWYRLNVVLDPSSTSCFDYGHLDLQVSLSGFTIPPPAYVGVNVYVDVSGTQAAPVDGGSNEYLNISNFGGKSCGSMGTAYIRVDRDPALATPFAYTLGLKLFRTFYLGPPQVTGISPTSGPVGTPVTLIGTGLLPTVKFGGVDASLTNYSATSITTSVPAGAKTGPISVYSTSSQQVFTVTAPAAVGPGGPRTANPSAALPATACCAVVPNPALAGRLGRVVVAFPSKAVPSNTSVAVIKDGQELQSGYGSQTWELLPGNYDLSVSGKMIKGVAVQARSDTHVHVGVLRISVGDQTHWEVLDSGTAIANGYGTKLVGLPPGSYGLRISGQTESFTIRDGEVVDF